MRTEKILYSKTFHAVVVLNFILKKRSLYFLNDGINSLTIVVLIWIKKLLAKKWYLFKRITIVW